MRQHQSLSNAPERHRNTHRSIRILLSLFLALSIFTIAMLHPTRTKAASTQKLPGEQIWQQGTSSLLFGANDSSWQWSPNNLGNDPAIATAVRNAGITVIRTPLHVSDAQARVSAVEAAGAKCLGIVSPPDALQVVQMLGNRCTMYEWMNEPDNNKISATAYANSWNQNIPLLRSANPQAIFIGPVVASPNTTYIQQFLTLAKQAGNIPDVVSYHTYPCTDQTIANCPAQIASYGQDASAVQATVNSTLGYTLPLAITEWNYSWKMNQTPQSDPFIKTFTTLSLDAMAQAGIAMATQYDLASNAGGGSLDMVDPNTGQNFPQIDAMHQAIQKYQLQQTAPTAPVTTGTQTALPIQPVQPQFSPQSVFISPPDSGLFLLGQSLHCLGKASATSQLNIDAPPTTRNVLALLGTTQDGCSLIFKVQSPQQTIRLNWWSENTTTTSLTFETATDSMNGPDSNWQAFPATSVEAAGGTQLIKLQDATWAKISIDPSAFGASPVNLVMELYSIDELSGVTLVPPQPIWLSRP